MTTPRVSYATHLAFLAIRTVISLPPPHQQPRYSIIILYTRIRAEPTKDSTTQFHDNLRFNATTIPLLLLLLLCLRMTNHTNRTHFSYLRGQVVVSYPHYIISSESIFILKNINVLQNIYINRYLNCRCGKFGPIDDLSIVYSYFSLFNKLSL